MEVFSILQIFWKKKRRSEYSKVKIVVILILISIITHEIKLLRESEK